MACEWFQSAFKQRTPHRADVSKRCSARRRAVTTAHTGRARIGNLNRLWADRRRPALCAHAPMPHCAPSSCRPVFPR